MTPEEQQAIQYRFSGYQLPMLQLDETGPAYIFLAEPHPYYRNQPAYWQKNAYRGNTLGTTSIVGGDINIQASGNTYANKSETTSGNDSFNLMDF